jgi:hypothetical protein
VRQFFLKRKNNLATIQHTNQKKQDEKNITKVTKQNKTKQNKSNKAKQNKSNKTKQKETQARQEYNITNQN